jgi:hypothetical protein
MVRLKELGMPILGKDGSTEGFCFFYAGELSTKQPDALDALRAMSGWMKVSGVEVAIYSTTLAAKLIPALFLYFNFNLASVYQLLWSLDSGRRRGSSSTVKASPTASSRVCLRLLACSLAATSGRLLCSSRASGQQLAATGAWSAGPEQRRG